MVRGYDSVSNNTAIATTTITAQVKASGGVQGPEERSQTKLAVDDTLAHARKTHTLYEHTESWYCTQLTYLYSIPHTTPARYIQVYTSLDNNMNVKRGLYPRPYRIHHAGFHVTAYQVYGVALFEHVLVPCIL